MTPSRSPASIQLAPGWRTNPTAEGGTLPRGQKRGRDPAAGGAEQNARGQGGVLGKPPHAAAQVNDEEQQRKSIEASGQVE